MITGYFASEIRRLNRNLARFGLLLIALALLWIVALERPYCRKLVAAWQASAHEGRPSPTAAVGAVWLPVPIVPGLLAVTGIFCLARALHRTVAPGAHPLARGLMRANPGDQLQAVEARLDRGWSMQTPIRFRFPFDLGNWSTSGKYSHHSTIRIGQGWFYYGCTLQADLRSLDDLVWFYRQDCEMRHHGVKLGTAHQLILRFRDGGEIVVSLGETESKLAHRIGALVQHLPNAAPFQGLNEDNRIDVLYVLQELAPWAIIGHDESMERAWRNPGTRRNLIEMVEHRKHHAQPPA